MERAKKKWGQHFLRDKNIARKIVRAANINARRLIMEIGPGYGILTEMLLTSGEHYIGIEIDPHLASTLEGRFENYPNFHLSTQDALEFDWESAIREYSGYRPVVLGNIPYNISSPILFKLFDNSELIDRAILMVQKEVGQRLIAKPSTKDYGLLAIFSQLYSDVQYLFTVSAKVFYPQPKVDSAVVRLIFKRRVKTQFSDYQLFQSVLRRCFQQRRKMLRKSLSGLFSPALLSKLDVDLTQRPEELSIPAWIKLSESIYRHLLD